MAEPPVKKAKTEDGTAAKTEPELEANAPSDTRPKLKDEVTFLTQDTTMNVCATTFGKMLTVLSDGGLQYLLAGARASAGVKTGRYMFETRIVELLSLPANPDGSRVPLPRSYLRVGLSLAGSSLILGETPDSVCFDIGGDCIYNKSATSLDFTLDRDDTIAVVLNLDDKSANFNTVSLFKNGERVCSPQALPDRLRGEVLYPTVTYRNLTLHYNFGPSPWSPLPFKCQMVQDAAIKDSEVTSPATPLDGKYEVLFPVCLPDEGTFQWLDMFLDKNPHYAELSDRAILDWAEKSSLVRHKGYSSRISNDKPEMGFHLASMDDLSVSKLLRAIAPIQDRHYIVMEVKANLMKSERKELLEQFTAPGYKTVALVLVGEPPLDFKKRTQELMLAQKRAASDAEFKRKLDEEKRQKELLKRQRELEKMKIKSEKQAKKLAEERKRKLEEELQQNLALFKTGSQEEQPEAKAEEAKDESADEDEPEDKEMEEPDPEPPKVSLTLDEKKLWFKKGPIMDLALTVHATYFTRFTLPDKDEGFDEIRQEWAKGTKCNECLRSWVQDRKLTTRVEELTPSEWFINKNKDWQKLLQSWHAQQNDYTNAVAKKAADKAEKLQMKAAKEAQKAAQRAAAEQAAIEKAAAAITDGAVAPEGDASLVKPPDDPEKKAEEEKPPEEKEEPEEPDEEVDFDKVDVFGVEDILNVGGKPAQALFSEFQFEDWTMMSLRYELNLLIHSFKKDVNDPDRLGIYMEHLPFYYQKYYKKALTHKFYGVETLKELLDLIRDTVVVNPKNQVLEPQLPEDLESQGLYVMLTEEARRDRQRRMDLGDKTAVLNLQQNTAAMVMAGAGMGMPGGAMGMAGTSKYPSMAGSQQVPLGIAQRPAGAPGSAPFPGGPGPFPGMGMPPGGPGMGMPSGMPGMGGKGQSWQQLAAQWNKGGGAQMMPRWPSDMSWKGGGGWKGNSNSNYVPAWQAYGGGQKGFDKGGFDKGFDKGGGKMNPMGP